MTDSEQSSAPAAEPAAGSPLPIAPQPVGIPGQPAFGAAPQPQFAPPLGYPPPNYYGYGCPPPQGGTNGLAIAAMVCGLCGFVCLVPALVGITLGIVSLPQIKRSQQSGRGMAITGIVMGALWLLAFAAILIFGQHGQQIGTGDDSGL